MGQGGRWGGVGAAAVDGCGGGGGGGEVDAVVEVDVVPVGGVLEGDGAAERAGLGQVVAACGAAGGGGGGAVLVGGRGLHRCAAVSLSLTHTLSLSLLPPLAIAS